MEDFNPTMDCRWLYLNLCQFFTNRGCIGEQWGAKKAFLSGLSIFIFASLGCGLSTGFVMLIFFRFIQGIGAALVVPTSLTLIHNQYEHQQQRARAIGIWAGLGGVAAATGPVLGAFLTSSFGWRAVFLVNIPIGLIGIALTLKYIARSQGKRTKKFDFQGLILAMTTIVALAYALIEVGQYGWFSADVVTGMVVAGMAFILFVHVEMRHPCPLFPLALFKSLNFSVAIVIGVILNIGMYGELFVLPLYFQNIQNYSVLETGFAILPLLSLIAIASYFAGQWIGRVGTKIPMIVGLAIGAFGFFLLLIVGDHSVHYIDLVFPMAAIGFGTAFTMPAATLAAIQNAPEGRAGLHLAHLIRAVRLVLSLASLCSGPLFLQVLLLF